MAQLISMATAFVVTWILFARVWESVLNTTYCLMSERGSKGERGGGGWGAREGTGKIEIGGDRSKVVWCVWIISYE